MSILCDKCGADISFEGEDHPNCDVVQKLRAELREARAAVHDYDMRTQTCVRHEKEAIKRAETAERHLQEVRNENACDACGGAGIPVSGLPCMCKGTGKMSVAAVYLRELLQEREMQMAGLVGEMKAIAVNRDDPILLGEMTKALSTLPSVEKYRRLMEALSKPHPVFQDINDNDWLSFADWIDEVEEAFRAIKDGT